MVFVGGLTRRRRATVASAPPNPQGGRRWTSGLGWRAEGLVALYTIESGQPAISEIKAAGLRERYGLDGLPATEYFDVHARRDREHAAAERALIEPRLAEADAEAL